MSNGPQTLNITEQHALLDHLLAQGGTHTQHIKAVRNYTMATTMLEAGLRVGELVRLRWQTLYFNCLPVKSIIISPEIAEKGASRDIPVSTRLSDALSQYHLTQSTFKSDLDNPYAFTASHTDLPLTTRQVERIIRHASLKALGKPIHPHVLRHTFASKLMRVTNASVVQELLGHKHLSSTQVYCHPNGEDLKRAIHNAEKDNQSAYDILPSGVAVTDLSKDNKTVPTDR